MTENHNPGPYRFTTIRQRQLAECSDSECIALAHYIAARKKKGLAVHNQEAELRLEYSRMKHATQILNSL